jgi:hypothetical protein
MKFKIGDKVRLFNEKILFFDDESGNIGTVIEFHFEHKNLVKVEFLGGHWVFIHQDQLYKIDTN